MATLKPKGVWHVVEGDDFASSSATHQNGTHVRDDGAGTILYSDFIMNVASSVILQGLEEEPFACVMAYQDDLQ